MIGDSSILPGLDFGDRIRTLYRLRGASTLIIIELSCLKRKMSKPFPVWCWRLTLALFDVWTNLETASTCELT
jgi:hypothetical protein